ncbi:hypothetical protein soil367_17660 [Hydrocarboniclastica marina]|uniref:Uncharacterized protein n=1 Tax=Hydrocarboniclastica marina TaxID=2259620 RepID=A0A4P7XKE4_9ALTE|nr:hypothetical protein soil367_17660 [Hydrocarboniclastica marina]
MENLRGQLTSTELAWERAFGIAPLINTVFSGYDAARLGGSSTGSCSLATRGTTVVQRGHDYIFNSARYQVKGNRPTFDEVKLSPAHLRLGRQLV